MLILIVSALLLSGANKSAERQTITKDQIEQSPNKEKEETRNHQESKTKENQGRPDKNKISTIRHTKQAKAGGNDKDDTKESHNWIDWYAAFGPITWSNWTLSVLAGIAAIVAACTLRTIRVQTKATRDATRAAQRSSDIAEDSLRVAQRAYLDVSFDEDFVPRPDIPLEVNWKISNSGQTRGIITYMDVKFHVAPGLPNRIESTGKKSGVIVPGNGYRIPRIGHDRMLSRDETDALFNRRSNLVIYGLILYRDIFNVEHFTRFCWVWDKRARSGKGGFVFPIEADPELNDAD